KRKPGKYTITFDDEFATVKSTKTITVKNAGKKEKIKLYLDKEEKITEEDIFSAPTRFYGAKGSLYKVGSEVVDIKGNKPVWSGYEKDIAKELSLSDSASIISAAWTSGYKKVGKETVRDASYQVKDIVTKKKATYIEEGDSFYIYSASFTYSEPAAKVYVGYYEKNNFLRNIVAAGIGVLVLAGLIAGILIFLRRRRESEAEYGSN
ncbi:MAG: hypothetical protein ACRCUS_01795, partial [Anaerovoracaceae bacterium]